MSDAGSMPRYTWPLDRIADAGISVSRIQKSSVLVKVDDIPDDQVHVHPVSALIRGLRAIGVGTIHLRGTADYLDDLAGGEMPGTLDQDPGVWLDRDMAGDVPETDMILDLSNSRESRVLTARLASERSLPLLAVAWGSCWVGAAAGADSIDMVAHQAEGCVCSPVIRLAAGLALQEFLITVGDVALTAPLEEPVFYNASSPDRTGLPGGTPWPTSQIERAVIDVVGAGGIGVHLLESLVPLLGKGCQLRLFDPDIVGPENLALQISYTPQDLGRPKSEAAAGRLRVHLASNAEIQPFSVRYQDRPSGLLKPDVRVTCPDNFAVRYHANTLSLEDGAPLVDAASSSLAAQQRTFYPGRTACLEHRLHDLASKVERESERASCASRGVATTPGVNMVIGSIQALEVLHALRPGQYGGPSNGTITFDARFPQRFGIAGFRRACADEH